MTEYEFTAELRTVEIGSEGAAYWLPLPEEIEDQIRGAAVGTRGFGSVRVEATIGTSTWRTSVFPSKELGTYFLPVKKPVRDAEGLVAGSHCTVRLRFV